MCKHTIEAEVEVKFTFPGLAEGEHETAYPTLEITYSYIGARPAYTPRGEHAPIDPPEPAEIEFISARLLNGDGLSPSQDQVDNWAEDWLESDKGYCAAVACAACGYAY